LAVESLQARTKGLQAKLDANAIQVREADSAFSVAKREAGAKQFQVHLEKAISTAEDLRQHLCKMICTAQEYFDGGAFAGILEQLQRVVFTDPSGTGANLLSVGDWPRYAPIAPREHQILAKNLRREIASIDAAAINIPAASKPASPPVSEVETIPEVSQAQLAGEQERLAAAQWQGYANS
jgi:hypothetical protein